MLMKTWMLIKESTDISNLAKKSYSNHCVYLECKAYPNPQGGAALFLYTKIFYFI